MLSAVSSLSMRLTSKQARLRVHDTKEPLVPLTIFKTSKTKRSVDLKARKSELYFKTSKTKSRLGWVC